MPTRKTIGHWIREAGPLGGLDALRDLLLELAGKGKLERGPSPQSLVFAALKRRQADAAKAATAERAAGDKDRRRAELDHVRGYLHGRPEDQPHHEQALREAAGDGGLLWEPPTQADLERLEAELYGAGPQRAAGGVR
jgi:hypothetical protein